MLVLKFLYAPFNVSADWSRLHIICSFLAEIARSKPKIDAKEITNRTSNKLAEDESGRTENQSLSMCLYKTRRAIIWRVLLNSFLNLNRK